MGKYVTPEQLWSASAGADAPWIVDVRRAEAADAEPEARFLFVEPDQVLATAKELDAVADNIEAAPITYEGDRCSFDVLLGRRGFGDPGRADTTLLELATMIRGADTARPDLAPEAAGLLAISIGISARCGEHDHQVLHRGIAVYDALYAWRRKAPDETHDWPSDPRT